MPANYLYPAGQPVAPPIVNNTTNNTINKTINKTENKTVNVFHPKPERDIIDDIGRSADAFHKVTKAFQDFNPFSHIPFLPIGGMGQNNPGAGEFPEPFPLPYEPPIIPEIPIIPI
jgi:hypothetical protein